MNNKEQITKFLMERYTNLPDYWREEIQDGTFCVTECLLKLMLEAEEQRDAAEEKLRAADADGSECREVAKALWGLLDDIDTASDMFKPRDEASYKAFYEYAMKKAEERAGLPHTFKMKHIKL